MIGARVADVRGIIVFTLPCARQRHERCAGSVLTTPGSHLARHLAADIVLPCGCACH